jgi:uncharacterized DUF497 family protein
MKYEWDDGKRRENLRKHGLDFEDASEIFKGPRLVRLDIRIDYGEDRWVAIGIAKNRVVVVAYTEDDAKQLIRIISLRKALVHC